MASIASSETTYLYDSILVIDFSNPLFYYLSGRLYANIMPTITFDGCSTFKPFWLFYNVKQYILHALFIHNVRCKDTNNSTTDKAIGLFFGYFYSRFSIN